VTLFIEVAQHVSPPLQQQLVPFSSFFFSNYGFLEPHKYLYDISLAASLPVSFIYLFNRTSSIRFPPSTWEKQGRSFTRSLGGRRGKGGPKREGEISSSPFFLFFQVMIMVIPIYILSRVNRYFPLLGIAFKGYEKFALSRENESERERAKNH
jgi:hypothetical protein